MAPSWFEALKAAYGQKYSQLNEDLLELDDEIYACPRTDGRLKVNPSLDKIWEWTKPVSFDHVKVVIVGQDPSNLLDGSGFAFHPIDPVAPSQSTKNIFSMLAEQFSLTPFEKLERRNFSLKGWMDQGVVLVNAMTTKPYKKNDNCCGEHKCWIPIMKRLLNHIFDTMPNVVFILAGSKAYTSFYYARGGLSKKEKVLERVFLVEHPAIAKKKNRKQSKYPKLSEGLFKAQQRLEEQGIAVDFSKQEMWGQNVEIEDLPDISSLKISA